MDVHAFVTPTVGLGIRAGNRLESWRTSVAHQQKARVGGKVQIRMRVLEGLDTVSQQPYTFSRYILGPFAGIDTVDISGEEERELAIRAAYRQVFGNAYLMEEEREEFAVAESQFKVGALSAKELIRTMAKSDAYRTRFFEGAGQYRFIELNFKHLLGRSPDSQEEISTHVKLYALKGYDAEIDSYLDSEEYSSLFGYDIIPFLRFRGAYTPCDSFNKQCALQGGWANSDKAMGGAALSGWNGWDGRQMSALIPSYAATQPTPYEAVAGNTPLKTTAPNWYACPNPALPPEPAFVSPAEVAALREKVDALQAQYNAEVKSKSEKGKDYLGTFRSMVKEMGVCDRGFAYSGGINVLSNPYARQLGDESPLAIGGSKSSDYLRYGNLMECDTLSRLEKLLEEAKAELRVLEKALAKSTPVTPPLELPGQVTSKLVTGVTAAPKAARPRVQVRARPPVKVEPKPEKPGIKIGGVTLPSIALPSIELPSVSLDLGSLNVFRKK